MHYKGTRQPLPAIARELSVRHVLEGSVRRAGASVRITAQLVDGTTDAHLWAEKYDGTADDVLGLQEQLSRRIVEALKGRITGTRSSVSRHGRSRTCAPTKPIYARAMRCFGKPSRRYGRPSSTSTSR